jgi:hypothetical protein
VDRHVGLAVAVIVGVVGIATISFRSRSRDDRRQVTLRSAFVIVPAVIVAVGGLWGVSRSYLDTRYRDDPIDAWAQDQHDRRIAVAEVSETYPLYGTDLTNHVQWVGEVGDHGAFGRAPSCAAWRDGLRRGRYEFVVVGTSGSGDGRATTRWTAADPAASPLIETSTRTLYSFDPTVPDPGCEV